MGLERRFREGYEHPVLKVHGLLTCRRRGRRNLDDSELDSGDDEGRRDRSVRADGEGEQDEESATIQDVQLGRHPVPEGSDGEVRPQAFKLQVSGQLLITAFSSIF